MNQHLKRENCNLLAEADHRIANHFAMLAGHVRLKTTVLARQTTEPSRDEMLLILQSIGVHIDAVASLHRILANDGLRAFTDLDHHLRNICDAFRSGPAYDFVLIENFESGCALPLNQLLPVTQIFAEAITNAVKHGHSSGKAGTIRASCGKDAGGTIVVEVIDEGRGLPQGFDCNTQKGFGFRLVEALSKQIGGLVDYQSSDRGLRFRLTLPLSLTPDLAKPASPTTLRQRLSMFRARRNGDAERKEAASSH